MASPIIPWIGGKRRLADQLIPRFPPAHLLRRAVCRRRGDVLSEATGARRGHQRHQRRPGEPLSRGEAPPRGVRAAVSNGRCRAERCSSGCRTPRRRRSPTCSVRRASTTCSINASAARSRGRPGAPRRRRPPINLLRIEEQLSAAHLRLSSTYIESKHWRECMLAYDRPHTSSIATPRTGQTEGYGVSFPWEEYVAMAEAFRSIKGRAMLSINDHPDVRALFSGFHVETLDISYTVGGGARAADPEGTGRLVLGSGDRSARGCSKGHAWVSIKS